LSGKAIIITTTTAPHAMCYTVNIQRLHNNPIRLNKDTLRELIKKFWRYEVKRR